MTLTEDDINAGLASFCVSALAGFFLFISPIYHAATMLDNNVFDLKLFLYFPEWLELSLLIKLPVLFLHKISQIAVVKNTLGLQSTVTTPNILIVIDETLQMSFLFLQFAVCTLQYSSSRKKI